MIGRRGLMAGIGALAAGGNALAQPPSLLPALPPPGGAPAPAAPPKPALGYGVAPAVTPGAVRVVIHTSEGDIIADLFADKAPITVANFLHYTDTKRYDASTFYRASHPGNMNDYGVIQAGLNGRGDRMYKPITLEPTSQTGLKHGDGTLSMGRREPNSATSEYFICLGESSYLDADPSKPGDNLGFAAFGQVVQGMDVVKKILVLPTNPTKGVGSMKGEYLEPPVPITTVRRV